MLETLKAIKRTLLTENIYEGDIFFLQDKNENSFEKAYIASYAMLEPKYERRRVLFKTGDSPYYVSDEFTEKSHQLKENTSIVFRTSRLWFSKTWTLF